MVFEVAGLPRVIFRATRRIEPNEELFWNYGIREKKTIELFPWLKE